MGDGRPIEQDSTQELQKRLLGRLIVGQTIAVFLLTVMTAVGGVLNPGSGLLTLTPLGAIAVGVGLVSYWLRWQGRVRLASYVFVLGTALAITYNLSIRGYQDASALYYLWPILGAAALLGTGGSVPVAAVCAALYGVLVALEVSGLRMPPLPYDPIRESLLTVGSRILVYFLAAFLGWLSSRNLERALQRARQAAQDLGELNAALEGRIVRRTRDLERRSQYLEAAAGVARDAAAVLDPRDLSSRVVDLIRNRFGFYHAGLFTLDESGEWAVLQAASSEGGKRMLARGHRLRTGTQGIVGYVAGRGVHRVALDVGEDAAYFDNPDLADTRSEIALPLRAGGAVIGVLDVQSREAEAFSEEDVGALQTLADQVAVALTNARLFQQVEMTLEAEQRARGELTREAWADLMRERPNLGFLSDTGGTVPAGDVWDEEMIAAVQTGETRTGDGDALGIAVPVKTRGQVVGVIDAHLPDDGGEWTPEQRELLETLAEQLGIALESAQLYQDAQRRAAREQVTREVTDRMRSAIDMDELLRTAISETASVLGASRAFVQWVPSEQTGDGNERTTA